MGHGLGGGGGKRKWPPSRSSAGAVPALLAYAPRRGKEVLTTATTTSLSDLDRRAGCGPSPPSKERGVPCVLSGSLFSRGGEEERYLFGADRAKKSFRLWVGVPVFTVWCSFRVLYPETAHTTGHRQSHLSLQVRFGRLWTLRRRGVKLRMLN